MPTTTLNVSTDYTMFDNYHTVSLTSQDGLTTVSSKRAIKRVLSQAPTAQGIATVVRISCRWHVFVSQLGTFIPQEQGYVTDEDGIKHYIDSVSLETWATRYVLQTTAHTSADLLT